MDALLREWLKKICIERRKPVICDSITGSRFLYMEELLVGVPDVQPAASVAGRTGWVCCMHMPRCYS